MSKNRQRTAAAEGCGPQDLPRPNTRRIFPGDTVPDIDREHFGSPSGPRDSRSKSQKPGQIDPEEVNDSEVE
jgi:hypothetical protein